MKRPLSLTLLAILSGLLGAFSLLSAVRSLKNMLVGVAWEGIPLSDKSIHLAGLVFASVFAGILLWLILKRRNSARVVGATFLVYCAGKFFYSLIFIPSSRRSLGDLQAQYDNPGFGLMMENVISFVIVVLFLAWAYRVFSAAKVKEYLSPVSSTSTSGQSNA
jgi:hypothetical protein